MCAKSSVYSWDVVFTRQGDKLFIDKRDGGPLDLLTVNETAPDQVRNAGAVVTRWRQATAWGCPPCVSASHAAFGTAHTSHTPPLDRRSPPPRSRRSATTSTDCSSCRLRRPPSTRACRSSWSSRCAPRPAGRRQGGGGPRACTPHAQHERAHRQPPHPHPLAHAACILPLRAAGRHQARAGRPQPLCRRGGRGAGERGLPLPQVGAQEGHGHCGALRGQRGDDHAQGRRAAGVHQGAERVEPQGDGLAQEAGPVARVGERPRRARAPCQPRCGRMLCTMHSWPVPAAAGCHQWAEPTPHACRHPPPPRCC